MPKFCFGSFRDVLFWFLWGHSNSNIGRTSVVHKVDFSGAEDLHATTYV